MRVRGHVCQVGPVVFSHSDQVVKTFPIILILYLNESKVLEYIMGVMESVIYKFALYGSKTECTRTDIDFFH